MMGESVEFLTPDRARYLVEVAEEARANLSRLVGYEVVYDSVALQLLDEWIDRHVRQSPHPSQATRLLWASFLGEMFRRRHEGEWILLGRDQRLAVLCPTEGGDPYTVDVSGQVGRRITEGMSASLALFYVTVSVELKAGQSGTT
jgi:hypothetical protein